MAGQKRARWRGGEPTNATETETNRLAPCTSALHVLVPKVESSFLGETEGIRVTHNTAGS